MQWNFILLRDTLEAGAGLVRTITSLECTFRY